MKIDVLKTLQENSNKLMKISSDMNSIEDKYRRNMFKFNELIQMTEDFYDAICQSYDGLNDIQKEIMEEVAQCLRRIKEDEEI